MTPGVVLNQLVDCRVGLLCSARRALLARGAVTAALLAAFATAWRNDTCSVFAFGVTVFSLAATGSAISVAASASGIARPGLRQRVNLSVTGVLLSMLVDWDRWSAPVPGQPAMHTPLPRRSITDR